LSAQIWKRTRPQGLPHVNDQFAPFASHTIPAKVSEAPYILDGPLMNEAGPLGLRAICRYGRLYVFNHIAKRAPSGHDSATADHGPVFDQLPGSRPSVG
jgi:hypothetical protein